MDLTTTPNNTYAGVKHLANAPASVAAARSAAVALVAMRVIGTIKVECTNSNILEKS